MEDRSRKNSIDAERAKNLLNALNDCTMDEVVWAVSRAGMWIVPFRPQLGVTVGPPKELLPITRELARLASTMNFALRSLGNRRVRATSELFEMLDEKRVSKDLVNPIRNTIRDRVSAIQGLVNGRQEDTKVPLESKSQESQEA